MAIADLTDTASLMKPHFSDDSDTSSDRPGRQRTVLSDQSDDSSRKQRMTKSKQIASAQTKFGKKQKKRGFAFKQGKADA